MYRCLPSSLTLLWCLWAGLCAAQVADDDRQIASGKTLAEWRIIIQQLDPQSTVARDVVSGLTAIVADEEVPWFTRRQAALTLGRIGTPAASAVPKLIQLLDAQEGDRETTRLWAAKSLALFGPVAATAAPRLSEIAQSEQEPLPLRLTTVESLTRIGADSPAVLPALTALLAPSGQPEHRLAQVQLRMAAAEGLGLLGPAASSAIPQLLLALRDGSPLLRLAAATTLGTLGPAGEVAIPALVDTILFDDAPEVADAAARSLGRIGIVSLPALGQLIHDQDSEARLRGVWGLLETGPAGQLLLKEALSDQSPLVAVWAASGLLDSRSPGHQRAVKTLLDALVDDDRQVRIKAYRVLQLAPQVLVGQQEILRELRDSPRSDVARSAQGLLDAFAKHLRTGQ